MSAQMTQAVIKYKTDGVENVFRGMKKICSVRWAMKR